MSTGPVGTRPEGAVVMVVFGAAGARVFQLRCAGEGSVLWAWSVARTARLCWPVDGAAIWTGEVQGANAAPSLLHSKLLPASVEVKENSTWPSGTSPCGPEVIVVSGGVASTV